jgi:type I restriction enzyme R subunit
MAVHPDDLPMQSINFEFLKPHWPDLAQVGGFAEAYAHDDPIGAITKLRIFCEQTVRYLHHKLRLPPLLRPNLIDLLDDSSFRDAVPTVVLNKLHALRISGNHAVHSGTGDTTTALRLLKEAHDLARWLFMTHAGGRLDDCPPFTPPPEGGAAGVARRKEKRAILERVAAQEAQLQQLLQTIETERARAEQAVATAEEWRQARELGQQTAAACATTDPLAFNEDETRRYLIDTLLAEVGWVVGPGQTSTHEVKKELQVAGQSTSTGLGYADYVLLDDNGHPLAVIEAKKTAVEADVGRHQAKCYADGLEAQYGQRPIIFFTNGYDISIWNDAALEPPRRLYGFYSKDSLQRLMFQRRERRPLAEVGPDPAKNIIDRMYQFEAVRRVVEDFARKKRKALIVQATGTGKTRVAIALCDALLQARWAKRILFLCDRRELRRQALNAFKQFLPSEPRVEISSGTARDRNARIYLATYPAMMKVFESFDPGYFDLIIADESHRSLYNSYLPLLRYFDGYQLGLTATPISYVSKSTYAIFQCENGDPTFSYTYEQAVNSTPPYVAPFEVESQTTKFLRDGIKYDSLTAEQKRQLEEDEALPQTLQYEQAEVDKLIFNKDTNRIILRHLMERGIRGSAGSLVGKTIVFARSHQHAQLLETLFDEMYPQFGGRFCQVIDNYNPRAEDLIDDFKGVGSNPDLTIAISVDMLDTGIDVPQVVNLVFAKPIYSYTKFWQMIGRGTRLCPDLFGPGQHKTVFKIFDHWGNFDRFGQDFRPADPPVARSVLQGLFEDRLELARTALSLQQAAPFELALRLVQQDLAALPERSIPVREKWREVRAMRNSDTLREFSAATQATLAQEVAPLMQWTNITGHEPAHRFDRLITQLQIELLRQSSRWHDLKDEVLDLISRLPINLSQVRDKLELIERAKSAEFWDDVTVGRIEELRVGLRGLIQYIPADGRGRGSAPARVVDIAEDRSQIEHSRRPVQLRGVDLAAYRSRVHDVLQRIIDQNPTLQKIKANEPVAPAELDALCSLVLTHDDSLDLHHLIDYFPESAGHLDQAIRSIIGLDAGLVRDRFNAFVRQHPTLAATQIRFLDMLQNHIARYGSIEVDRLYEPPFTQLHTDSLDGLFDEPTAGELLHILDSFKTHGRQA